MNYLFIYKIGLPILYLILNVLNVLNVCGQTCPDGFPAAFKCTVSKKHKDGYYCKGDPKLGCEIINGVSYCCDKDKSDELSVVSNKPFVGQFTNDTQSTKKEKKTTLSPKKNKEDSDENETSNKEEKRGKSKKTTTTTSSSIKDCIDRGGECRLRANLCSNPLYEGLMRNQCPVTCKKCDPIENKVESENKEETGSNDKHKNECGENRGPDCDKYPHLCHSPYYIDFMKDECPRTCNPLC